jgi:hypothetical protein
VTGPAAPAAGPSLPGDDGLEQEGRRYAGVAFDMTSASSR